MEQVTRKTQNTILKFLLASVLIYAVLGLFGGLPGQAHVAGFVVGLVVLFLLVILLLSFGWYAVIKPLPDNLAPSKHLPLTPMLRQGIAIFMIIMSLIGVAGGIWDVTWHVRSGLPFGKDFFWAPHQFIYAALTAPILVAFFLWIRLMRNSNGTMQQRFKADIPVTLIMIGGMTMMFILPADPIWHFIYGEDLTGLSVPHFVFSVSSTITMIGVLSILLSYRPVQRSWTNILKISGVEILMMALIASTMVSLLMPTLGDWEAITLPSSALPRLPALVASRPDWALPFLAAFVGIFPCAIALQVTKRYGTATFVWVMAAIARSILFLVLGYNNTGMISMFLILPFVLALDGATWYRTSRQQAVTPLFVAVVATVVGAIAALPQIALFFTDPVLSVSNVPLMIVAIFVAALLATFMGSTLGNTIFNTVRFEVPEKQPVIMLPIVRYLSAFTIVVVGVAIFFIVTSKIPT